MLRILMIVVAALECTLGTSPLTSDGTDVETTNDFEQTLKDFRSLLGESHDVLPVALCESLSQVIEDVEITCAGMNMDDLEQEDNMTHVLYALESLDSGYNQLKSSRNTISDTSSHMDERSISLSLKWDEVISAIDDAYERCADRYIELGQRAGPLGPLVAIVFLVFAGIMAAVHRRLTRLGMVDRLFSMMLP